MYISCKYHSSILKLMAKVAKENNFSTNEVWGSCFEQKLLKKRTLQCEETLFAPVAPFPFGVSLARPLYNWFGRRVAPNTGKLKFSSSGFPLYWCCRMQTNKKSKPLIWQHVQKFIWLQAWTRPQTQWRVSLESQRSKAKSHWFSYWCIFILWLFWSNKGNTGCAWSNLQTLQHKWETVNNNN